MDQFRYILEPYNGMSSRYTCKECGKLKNFSRYIDTETGEQLSDHVGRCNSEISCGYHYTPKQYFEDNGETSRDEGKPSKPSKSKTKAIPKPPSFIPPSSLKGSLKGYEQNHLITYLKSMFGDEIASQLISRYLIGTSNHWPGATVFWQVDNRGKIRSGKIMLYSPTTGKRVKKPYNHITWAHKALNLPEFNLKQCFFGEHLLKDKTKPVAIVESEKTAIVASHYLSQFIWLAVGSLANLSREKCRVLQDRKVILFPDLNGFNKWQEKAKELSDIASFRVSDLLERKASAAEREQGLDLADYLVRPVNKGLTIPEPKKPNNTVATTNLSPPITKNSNNEGYKMQQIKEGNLPPVNNKGSEKKQRIATNSENQFNDTDPPITFEVEELESFFSGFILPGSPVKLDSAMTVTDIPLFVKSHMTTIKANQGRRSSKPYFDRLQLLKKVIDKSRNN